MSNQPEQKPPINFEEVNPASPEKEPKLKIWGEVTDPKEHDPTKFRYLVHAFNRFAPATQRPAIVAAELFGAYKVDTTQGPYEQEMFQIAENDVWAHFRGNRYNLGSENPEFAFRAYDDEFDYFFPSPQEINDVIAHLVKRGHINEEQAQQIRVRYNTADARRKSPKVEYNPETQEISRVTIEDGYAKNAVAYWLNASGYCFKVDMVEYKKALTKMMLSQQDTLKGADGYRYIFPIPSTEVSIILARREETMEPDEYNKLVVFFSNLSQKINQAHKKQEELRKHTEIFA